MDVESGFAPRTLTRAMIVQRSMVPEDTDAIERLFHYLEDARPTMAEIKDAICEFYAIERKEIEGRDRRRFIILGRQMFCYFAHKYARASLHQIKSRVGYIDHSSVHHGIRMIEQYALTRPLIRDDLDLLRLRICEKLLLRSKDSTRC